MTKKGNKDEKMLTAVFRDRAHATRAYDWLQAHGHSTDHINILMSDRTRASFDTKGTEGKIKKGDMSIEGVATGGTIGTAVGATIGAILAIGTAVVIPGGFIIAGPLLAGLAGGGAGALTGGIVGGLIGLGIPETNAKAYEKALKDGGVVFGVVPRNTKDGEAIEEYFKAHGAENIVYANRA